MPNTVWTKTAKEGFININLPSNKETFVLTEPMTEPPSATVVDGRGIVDGGVVDGRDVNSRPPQIPSGDVADYGHSHDVGKDADELILGRDPKAPLPIVKMLFR